MIPKDIEPLLKECEETLTDLLRLGNIEVACYVQGVINSINKFPEVERPNGEWILCSDRLPEKNGDYLVTMEGMCRPYMRFLGYSATSKKWGYGGVIAWMDVKPYKKEGDGNES